MSGAARHRDRWLPVFLVAAFLVLALGSRAAWPAVGGGHGGGFSGGGHGGGSSPRGREFGGRGFGGRPVPHEHDHDGRPFFVFPYFYDPYYGYEPYYPDYPYDAYCDPYWRSPAASSYEDPGRGRRVCLLCLGQCCPRFEHAG